MPAYNFQKQFAPMIRSGEKRTTIRPIRVSRPTRVGDTLYLFTGMRTKQCERIGVYRCFRISPIVIVPIRQVVVLNGYALARWEIENLAYDDGFPDSGAFFEFFRKTYGAQLPKMELLAWEPTESSHDNLNKSTLPEHTPLYTTV